MKDDVIALENELWKPAAGFEGVYEVSESGRIKRIKRAPGARCGRLLKAYPLNGYPAVDLAIPDNPNKTRHIHVHNVVAHTFLGLRPPKHQVNHIDGDKQNSHWSNLEYVSCKRSIQHCHDTGLRELSGRRLAIVAWRCEQKGVSVEVFALGIALACQISGIKL